MISISDKSLCCGCGACEQICPQQCISMTRDAEGFLYPCVDESKCVSCGLCNKVCPIEASEELVKEGACPKAFGGNHIDEKVREASSSGGAFSLFAERILSDGGLVFGCALDENMHAIHTKVDSIEKLDLLRGSKYVQSEIGHAYKDVKAALDEGRKVLFVGTPCQAAGLYTYLGKKKCENLYIVDFICHGVPSPQIFKEFIESEQIKNGSTIIAHKFRNKDYGWNQSGLQLGSLSRFENGNEVRRYPAFSDKYMNGFLDDVYLRLSCYDCKFKNMPKMYSDFTIADFWGLDKVAPELNDQKGTSLILINSEQGEKLWEQVCSNFEYKEVDYTMATKRNKPLTHSASTNPNRERFFKDYEEKGYKYVEKKYMSAFTWAFHKSIKIGMQLLKRFEQFIKFAIVGCSNTIINLIVYYSLMYLGCHYLIAYTCGFLVSVCNAFYWNNKYVFVNKQEKSLIKAFIKVFSSYGMSFLFSVVLMSVLVEVIGVSSYVAPILKMIITIPLNFLLNKIWAFKDKK